MSISRDEWVALQASEMPERRLQGVVEVALKENGWTFYHAYDSRRSNPGLPDIIALRGPRLIWRELKDMKGRLTTEQRAWKLALETAGQDWDVWRPDQWFNESILMEIR